MVPWVAPGGQEHTGPQDTEAALRGTSPKGPGRERNPQGTDPSPEKTGQSDSKVPTWAEGPTGGSAGDPASVHSVRKGVLMSALHCRLLSPRGLQLQGTSGLRGADTPAKPVQRRWEGFEATGPLSLPSSLQPPGTVPPRLRVMAGPQSHISALGGGLAPPGTHQPQCPFSAPGLGPAHPPHPSVGGDPGSPAPLWLCVL